MYIHVTCYTHTRNITYSLPTPSHSHSHSHPLPPAHRQELLSAQDRISHLHDRLAMSRLQSRGNTPSRPSPPDGGVGGDFGGGPHGTGGGPAHYEMYGRHSPTKAAYGGRGLLNMTQPHRAASFHEHRNQGKRIIR